MKTRLFSQLRRLRLLCLTGMVGLGSLYVFLASVKSPPANTSSPVEVSSHSEVAVAAGVSTELLRILNEPDELVRRYRLADWVGTHTLEHINAELLLLSSGQRLPVHPLVWLKLRDMALATPEQEFTLMRQYPVLFSGRTHQNEAKSLRSSLWIQAEHDPLEAFRRATTLRMAADDRAAAVQHILDVLSKKDPRQALQLLEQAKGISRNEARGQIVQNWTKLDPAAAFSWARQQPASTQALHTVLSTWSEIDPGAALEATTDLPVSVASQVDTGSLLRRWIEASPTDSIAWLKTVAQPDPQLISAAVHALGKTHPQVAVNLLSNPLSAPLRSQLTASLVSSWAETDPVSAARWVQTLPRTNAYLQAAQRLMEPLARNDLPAAIAFYQSLPEGVSFTRAAAAIAQQMPAHDALRWLLGQPSSDASKHALNQIFERPEFSTAAQLQTTLGTLPPGPALNAASAVAARRQLSENPAGLSAWIRNLPNDDSRVAALKSIGGQWAEKSFPEAAAYARELGAGAAFDALLPGLRSQLVSRDPAAAADWMLSLPASKAVHTELRYTFQSLAEKRPFDAVQKISALPSGEIRSTALNGLISGLSNTQPEQAARTLFAIATPSEQMANIKTIANRWAAHNPATATTWIQTMSAGPRRDAALSSAVSYLTSNEPAAPLSLLSLAASDDARYAIANASLQALQYRDEQSARAALARLTLPPEMMERLKAQLDSNADH